MFRVLATTSKVSRGSLVALTARRAASPVVRLRWNSNTAPSTEERILTPEEIAKKERRAALDLKDDLQRDWDAKEISYAELKPKTQRPDVGAYLIDVREPDEVLQGMIPSAVNLPLSIFAKSIRLKPVEFREQFGFLLPTKNQEVTFYCRSGKRSASAADMAKRAGYTNVLNYKGSWLEWVEKEGK